MNGKIIEAKSLREKAEFTIKPNKSGVESGIYKWWASKSEIKAIFDALEINLNDVINGVEKKEDENLYAIYVGQAGSLEQRLKNNHVNGRSRSTFRKSIGAILLKISGQKNLYENINGFIDKLKIEYKFVDGNNNLDEEEKKEIGKKYLRVFNGQHNSQNELRKQFDITKKLNDLRSAFEKKL